MLYRASCLTLHSLSLRAFLDRSLPGWEKNNFETYEARLISACIYCIYYSTKMVPAVKKLLFKTPHCTRASVSWSCYLNGFYSRLYTCGIHVTLRWARTFDFRIPAIVAVSLPGDIACMKFLFPPLCITCVFSDVLADHAFRLAENVTNVLLIA